ncbi:MAG: lipid A deacylase LpxR family protein [Bdellovibrionaceae bacterium]|nr:lipid A deacylase LpxR family protein [Pseudobdellovibrionaceae bacterium]
MKINILVALIFSFSFSTLAEIKKTSAKTDGEAIAVYFENDSRSLGGPGSDQSYTNGFRASYIYAENKLPLWAEKPISGLKILDGTADHSKLNLGISLGHQIYTPNNIGESNLIPNDRPYAGWLYLGVAANIKEEHSAQFFEVDLGIVGPSARGREVQNNVHDWISKYRAAGWDHGLKDEFTLQLSYQKRLKIYAQKNFDLLPYYGMGVGNVLTAIHIGALGRFGTNLLDDFGPSRPSSNDGDSFISPMTADHPRKISYYGLFGVRTNLIARSIFIDGNTFQSSHRVTRIPLTFDTELGFGVQILPFNIVWRFVTRSPEFEERKTFVSFASLNLVYFL